MRTRLAAAMIGRFAALVVVISLPLYAQKPGVTDKAVKRFAGAFGPEVREGFAHVRLATSRFASLDSAVAAGYRRDVPDCLKHAVHGGMGYHHVNREYLDAKLEVERPEILLYEREATGKYALNGVEYIVPYRVWPADSVAPTLMGQTLKRSDSLKLWYLHMWTWKENPTGLFADWNPRVKCET